MSRIKNIRFKGISKPLRTVFTTSLGQKNQINSVLIQLTLDNDIFGTGEAPTSIAFSQETFPLMVNTLHEAAQWLKGSDISDWMSLIAGLQKRYPHRRMTISGLEVALFRAFLSNCDLSEYWCWGASQKCIETDITIPIFTDSRLLEKWIGSCISKGFRIFKLKVGLNKDRDKWLLTTVLQIVEAKVPGFRIRIDGNQAYSKADFIEFVSYLDRVGFAIELIEQPLRIDDWQGYEDVRNVCNIPLILDESVLCYDDARRVIDNNLCDGINIKIAKSGISESFKIIEAAKDAGKKVMMGCMMETMMGLSAAINLSAGTGAFDYIDLDAIHFMYGKHEYPGILTDGATYVINE
jgi:L-Ala-D/L-Glu epimerase